LYAPVLWLIPNLPTAQQTQVALYVNWWEWVQPMPRPAEIDEWNL